MSREDLKAIIVSAYESSVTTLEAEKYAALFLSAQLEISEDLASVDLDRRMRKRGLKSIKSAVRMAEIKKHDKKPTEGFLDDIVNLDKLVCEEEESFDNTDSHADALERDFGIFKDAHIYFRGIAKGNFNG